MKISVNIEINANKEKVWRTITDIENSAEMITAIKSLTVINKPERSFIGFKWRETREMFGKDAEETMWVTDSFAGEYYIVRAESHGAIYTTKMLLKKITEESTQLHMHFSANANSFFMKLISAVMGLFIKKSMIRMLNKDLEDIKTFIENE